MTTEPAKRGRPRQEVHTEAERRKQERSAAYYQQHRERLIAQTLSARARRLEDFREYQARYKRERYGTIEAVREQWRRWGRDYYQRNREKIAARRRAYYHRNREAILAQARANRSKVNISN